jgi:hypothetical protein
MADGPSGSFDINGRTFHFNIVEVVDYEGSVDTGAGIDDVTEADKIFYTATDDKGETYYRWLAGPFESVDDITAAIEDELDAYEEIAG